MYQSCAILKNICLESLLANCYQSICTGFYSQENYMLSVFSYERLQMDAYFFGMHLTVDTRTNLNYKNLIGKIFNVNTAKMKIASHIQVIKNKKQCLQLFLNRMSALILRTLFLLALSVAKVKFRAQFIFVQACQILA